MKRWLIVCLLWPLMAWQSASTEVSEANEAFFGALLNENVEDLDALLDSDFTLVMVDGKPYDRSLVLTALKAEFVKFESADLQSSNIKRLSAEVSYVTGIWKARGQLQGTDFDYRAYYTNILVRRGNSWKITQSQLTLVL